MSHCHMLQMVSRLGSSLNSSSHFVPRHLPSRQVAAARLVDPRSRMAQCRPVRMERTGTLCLISPDPDMRSPDFRCAPIHSPRSRRNIIGCCFSPALRVSLEFCQDSLEHANSISLRSNSTPALASIIGRKKLHSPTCWSMRRLPHLQRPPAKLQVFRTSLT